MEQVTSHAFQTLLCFTLCCTTDEKYKGGSSYNREQLRGVVLSYFNTAAQQKLAEWPKQGEQPQLFEAEVAFCEWQVIISSDSVIRDVHYLLNEMLNRLIAAGTESTE